MLRRREKALRVGAKLREQRLTRAAELVEGGIEETLAYYAFPEEHWRRIRTNNPLERILREIRRRTRVVGAFPDGQSALNLAAARLRHIAGTRMVDQEVSIDGLAEGSSDQEHHRLSPSRPPLSQNQSAKKTGHYLELAPGIGRAGKGKIKTKRTSGSVERPGCGQGTHLEIGPTGSLSTREALSWLVGHPQEHARAAFSLKDRPFRPLRFPQLWQ